MCLSFPARCLTCGKAVRAQRLVCRACAASLPKEPFFQEFPLPRAQEARLPVAAPLSYEKGTRRTLRRLKFQEERALAKPLAALMAQAVGQGGREFDGVVWVPMSPKKLQQRGYNQSQLLAKALAKELGLPWWTLLEQARETATQHDLTRAQRADNVRGAYRARAEAAGQRLLLVDDIVTTGATLRAAMERPAAYFDLDERGCLTISETFLLPKVEHYNYDYYAGVEYRMDVTKPVGERVVLLQYQGKPVQPTDVFSICMSNYRASGAGGYEMYTGCRVLREIGPRDREYYHKDWPVKDGLA